MVFKGLPGDRQKIPIWGFDAPADVHSGKAGCNFNQRTGAPHGRLKRRFLTWLHIQNCYFEDHRNIFSNRLRRVQIVGKADEAAINGANHRVFFPKNAS